MLKKTVILDKIGMCTSVLCIIHCLSIPLFLVFGFDSMLRLIEKEWIEWVIIAIALLIGVVSFLGGYLVHRKDYIPILFIAGFLLIISGESISNEWLSLTLSVSGASLIIYSHFKNLMFKQYAITD